MWSTGNWQILQRLGWAGALSGVMLMMTVTLGHAAGPGQGRTVQPVTTGRTDHWFQNFVVQIGLERLGYKVKPYLEAQFPAMYLAVANGEADYTAVGWEKLQAAFFDNAGGNVKMEHVGVLIRNVLQGYLIDKTTADKYHVTNLGQLASPTLARLFATSKNGKAHLTGCDPGWGCAPVIKHQLKAFGLENTVIQDQGSYFALIANTIARFKAGKPILYYTWTPLWVSSVLRPGIDTVWLNVPFSSLPGDQKGVDTTLPDGRNLGFPPDNVRIVANRSWLEKNPAAKRFFQLVTIPLADVNRAILLEHNGQSSRSQIWQAANEWVKAHKAQFDRWVAEAATAGQ